MIFIYLSAFFIYIFGVFNLVGIRQDLVFNHIIYFIIGLAGFFVVKTLGLHLFRQNARPMYWIFIFLLIFTYIVGLEIKGSRRWIDLYFFQFQPSELFKVFFMVYLADFYSKQRYMPSNRDLFLKSFLYFVLPAFIIFMQPDLGTSLVYGMVYLIMTLLSRLPKKYLIAVFSIAIIALPVVWNLNLIKDYQKNRLLSFINPQANKNTSYNMTQAIITSGSGQLFGRGLGLGKQSQLYFLPEFHTDFAYSSLVEQFGFFGGVTVIILYIVMAFFLLQRALLFYAVKDEQNRFKFFYTIGFLTFVLFQLFVNIGMNLGVMPIAGITLPLISYGGSSLVTFLVGLALLP